jgi:hypothetical protein
VLFAADSTTLFGAAAAFSTLVGVALAVSSHVSNRKYARETAAKETHAELLAARAEAESLSAQLHELRMQIREREQD